MKASHDGLKCSNTDFHRLAKDWLAENHDVQVKRMELESSYRRINGAVSALRSVCGQDLSLAISSHVYQGVSKWQQHQSCDSNLILASIAYNFRGSMEAAK